MRGLVSDRRKLSPPEATAVRRRALPMGTLGLIIASTTFSVLGQTLLKYGMILLGPQSLMVDGPLAIIVRILLSPFVVGGLLLYVSGAFFWLIALSRVQLSFLYPFASLSYVLIVTAGWLVFREQISLARLVGVAVICGGVLLVARS